MTYRLNLIYALVFLFDFLITKIRIAFILTNDPGSLAYELKHTLLPFRLHSCLVKNETKSAYNNVISFITNTLL